MACEGPVIGRVQRRDVHLVKGPTISSMKKEAHRRADSGAHPFRAFKRRFRYIWQGRGKLESRSELRIGRGSALGARYWCALAMVEVLENHNWLKTLNASVMPTARLAPSE